MKPPVDASRVCPVAGGATLADKEALPMVHDLLLRGWLRALAWLGLGCIGAGNRGALKPHCAPGCVKKQLDRKRRARPLKSRNVPPFSLRPKSAAGSLARRTSAADRAHVPQSARGGDAPKR
jgi:hypothetical protein